MISIIFLSLLGYCFLLKRFTKWPIECLPFLAISACIVILYIAAYAHFLPVAANVILIGGLFSLFVLYQARHQLWAEYLTPGFVIPLLFVVLFLLLTHGTHFSQWDEFTHWGPHAKLVLYHNGFIDAADAAVTVVVPISPRRGRRRGHVARAAGPQRRLPMHHNVGTPLHFCVTISVACVEKSIY